jgi:SAM-dependent methyltransferase
MSTALRYHRRDHPATKWFRYGTRDRMSRDKWNRRYSETERLWQADPTPELKKVVDGMAPGRALDLAAGEGRNALYLAESGWEVTAVDFSDVAINRGRERSQELGLPVTWEVADLTEYEPADGNFDLVCICYLQIPWPEMSRVVSEAARAVRPGGTFLLVGHDRSNLTHGVGGPQYPEVLYTPEDIVGLLSGLTVDRAEQARNPVDHGPEEGIQIDCVVVARRQ